MSQAELNSILSDALTVLRDRRKLGKESEADFLLEGQIADYIKTNK